MIKFGSKLILVYCLMTIFLICLIIGTLFYLLQSKQNIGETECGVLLGEGTKFTDTLQCQDNDNGVFYLKKGIVKLTSFFGLFKNETTDFCLNELVLIEYYCRNGQPYSIAKTCPTKCEDGKCLSCFDSDGGVNKTVKGSTTKMFAIGDIIPDNAEQGVITAEDHCFDENTLNEYHCNGENNLVQTSVECDGGCSDGRCIVCHDSDGGYNGPNFKVKGKITIEGTEGFLEDKCYIEQGDKSFTSTDKCSGEDCYLEEGDCSASLSKSWQLFPSDFLPCPGGCSDGACESLGID